MGVFVNFGKTGLKWNKNCLWVILEKISKMWSVVFSSQTEGSLVSDLFHWPSTFSLSSCQFLKFQARSFESCRMATNLIDVSTIHHKDGEDFGQLP